MFDRRFRFAASTLWLLFVAFSFVAGCSSDSANSPLQPSPTDQAPPMSPTGVGVANQAASKFMLRWAPNVDADLAGYRIYMYDPSPDRNSAFRCVSGSEPWRTTAFTYAGTDGTSYCFRVSAIDTSGNESAMSDPLTFSFTTGDNGAPGTMPGDLNQTTRGGSQEIGGHGWLPNNDGSTPTTR